MAETPSEDAVEAPLPNVDLSPALLYRLLVAEFAGQGVELHLSAEQYLSSAEETRDPRLAKRATRIAMYGNDSRTALRAASLWHELAPEDRNADQAIAAIFISAGQLADARPHLQKIIDTPALRSWNPWLPHPRQSAQPGPQSRAGSGHDG